MVAVAEQQQMRAGLAAWQGGRSIWLISHGSKAVLRVSVQHSWGGGRKR